MKFCRLYKISLYFLLFLILNIIFIPMSSLRAESDEITGLAVEINRELVNKELSSGFKYFPDSYVCITSKYKLFSILLVENLTNHKKTIVYVIDNSKSKFPDVVIQLSFKAIQELGEKREQFPVKIKLLKITTRTEIEKVLNKTKVDYYNTDITEKKTNNYNKNQNIENKDRYYIQVGAFTKEENAKKLQKELQVLGFSTFLIKQKVKNIIFYKVLIGPYSYKKAKEIIKILLKLGFKDCFIRKL